MKCVTLGEIMIYPPSLLPDQKHLQDKNIQNDVITDPLSPFLLQLKPAVYHLGYLLLI